MKRSVLAFAVLTLLQTASTHSHRHANHTAKRDDHVDPSGVAEVIVWVDQFGHTLSVETRGCRATVNIQSEPTSRPTQVQPVKPTLANNQPQHQPSQQSQSQSQSQSKSVETRPAHNPITFATPRQSTSPVTSSSSKASSMNAGPEGKYGVAYSPYRPDSTCKTQEEVNTDIDKLTDYSLIRIYGVDCDQVKTVSRATKRHNMKVFAGIYDLSNMPTNLKTLIDAAHGDWSTFDTISIGNELVNKGQNPPGEVVNAVNSARDTLRQAGYEGPVVTVDTFNVLIQHPELCQASDYCAANCHAFFDSTQTAADAGPFVKDQARKVSEAAGGKKTVITESGWPYAGQPNGAAIPSRESQRTAIKSLKHSFPDGGLILFTAFDDKWKADNRWTFSTERFWGFLH